MLTDFEDVKLYILCVLSYVDYPLEYADVNDMVMYEQTVSNMDFIEGFDKLVEQKLIIEDGDGLYSLSEQGQFVAKTLKPELSGFIHDRSLKAALQYLSFRKSGTKLDVTLAERSDGRYDAEFTITQKKESLMRLTLLLDTKYQAQKMAMTFREKPERLYAHIIAMLSGE